MAATPDHGGYWLVASDGGVFAFGDAGFYGSTGGPAPATHPVVGMAATPDGGGYWLVASDGGVFAFGDAAFAGSTGGAAPQPARWWAWPPAPDDARLLAGGLRRRHLRLRVGAASTGSTGALPLARPIVGMAAAAGTAAPATGWWPPTAASSPSAAPPSTARWAASRWSGPIVGMAPARDGQGYWLAASDGGIFAFGDAAVRGVDRRAAAQRPRWSGMAAGPVARLTVRTAPSGRPAGHAGPGPAGK